MPFCKDDETWITTGENKAAVFSNHLSFNFTPHQDISDRKNYVNVLSKLNIFLQLSLPPTAIKPFNVLRVINHLLLRKAPGGYVLISAKI